MKYSTEFIVEGNDTDVNGIAGASRVLRYMQEAANRQMKVYGPSNEELWDRGLAFILSRFSMCIYRPLYPYDKIIAETWGCESRGVSFERNGRITRDGEVIAELYTVWALVCAEDRSLVKVDDIKFGFTTDELLDFDAPQRVRIPRGWEMPLIGEHTVVYRDIDRNRHMNNTNYPDMLCDHLAGGMEGRRAARVVMHFRNEAPLGTTFRVYGGEYDSSCYFRTMLPGDKVGVEAEIVFEDIG